MSHRLVFSAYKLPSLALYVSIILVSLLLALFVQGCIKTAAAPRGVPASPTAPYYSQNENPFVAGADEAGHALGQELGKTGRLAKGGFHYTSGVIGKFGAHVAQGLQAVATGIGKGAMAVIRTAANAVIFVLRTPGNIYGFVAGNRVASAVITPSEHSHNNEVPIIDPNDPALIAAQKALPAIGPEKQAVAPGGPQEVRWPMHGTITTQFGERGRYYNPVHTGIDISDGNRSGVTPIKAYRGGTVSAAGRDGGLGNRVIVEHGNGVTSVYGHMASISVGVGQKVDTSTTLGFEGSTGVSTGTHLHFEIRVNGQAADPLLFIAGRP